MAKAAKLARRKAAKKQQGKRKALLSSKDREIMKFFKNLRPDNPAVRPAISKEPPSVSVESLNRLADDCALKGRRMQYAGFTIVQP